MCTSEEKTKELYKSAQEIFANFRLEFENEKRIRLSMENEKLSEIENEMKAAKHVRPYKQEELKKTKKALLATIQEIEKEEFDLEALNKKWVASRRVKSHKNITFLLKMACIVPGSTAVVEASWSRMNLICDANAATLTQDNLNKLMHISLNKEKIDYDAVLEIWKETKDRRT